MEKHSGGRHFDATEYDEYVLKGTYIEGESEAIRHIMGL